MIDYQGLVQKLVDAGLGDIGETITFDTLPASVSKGLCLRSNISGDDIDYEIPGFAKGVFRIIARSARYEEGEELLNNAIRALLVTRPKKIGKMTVRYCRPMTTPMNFPVSEGNYREFSVKMDICYEYDVSDCAWMDDGEQEDRFY
jgi:hypothetical protein